MMSLLKSRWVILGILQIIPLFICSQEEMLYTGPVVPDSIPPRIPIAMPPFSEEKQSLDRFPPGEEREGEFSTPLLSPSSVNRGVESEWIRGDQVSSAFSPILEFWFGPFLTADYFPRDKMSIWYPSDPDINRQILDNFEQDFLNAQKGEYNHWRNNPRGRLALILLLDQFPRYVYLNRPQEFLTDRMAKALVLEAIQKGEDKKLYPIERAFFYLPLQHAEDLELQDLSVAYYRQLWMESSEQVRPQIEDFLKGALLHRQQIARFGRFPYRNAILGRESTPEETEFLLQMRNSK